MQLFADMYREALRLVKASRARRTRVALRLGVIGEADLPRERMVEVTQHMGLRGHVADDMHEVSLRFMGQPKTPLALWQMERATVMVALVHHREAKGGHPAVLH